MLNGVRSPPQCSTWSFISNALRRVRICCRGGDEREGDGEADRRGYRDEQEHVSEAVDKRRGARVRLAEDRGRGREANRSADDLPGVEHPHGHPTQARLNRQRSNGCQSREE